MLRLTFLAVVLLTLHLSQGLEENTKNAKKCPLTYKKRGRSIKPFQCIDLKPPRDVEEALQTCWKEAINVDFKCMSMKTIFTMMRQAAKDRQSTSRPPSIGKPGDNATQNSGHHGRRKAGSGSSKRGNRGRGTSRRGSNSRKRASLRSRIQYFRRRMFKMIIFRHLLSNLNWWIFFTKDVSPPVFTRLVPEVKKKIQSRFRSCFTKKTGIEFGDKINAEHVIQKMRLYKGHESNVTLLINLTQQCSQNTTYQSEFSQCMTRNMAVTCIKKYVTEYWGKWRSRYSSKKTEEAGEKKEVRGKYQLPNKKAEDHENDQLTNQIVSKQVSDDDKSKDDESGKSIYGKGNKRRKGRSTDDDDDDNNDNEEEAAKETKDKTKQRMKAWKERLKGMKERYKKNKSKGGKVRTSSRYRRCEPCFNLKSSEELKTAVKQCWKTAGATSYSMKITNCVKATAPKRSSEVSKAWEERKNKMISRYLDGYWIKLFKPSTIKTSLYVTEEDIKEKQNCILGKLSLGTADRIDKKGFTEMIRTHLVGDEKVKEVLIKTVDKCGGGKPEGAVGYAAFTDCTLPTLETSCGV